MEEVQRFGSQLQQRIQETFDVIDTSWLAGIFAKQDVDVVLTGGSARVEMVQQLADGITESRGMKIVRKPAQRVPDWITQDYPQFSEEYPQLAVAMAAPHRICLRSARDTEIHRGWGKDAVRFNRPLSLIGLMEKREAGTWPALIVLKT